MPIGIKSKQLLCKLGHQHSFPISQVQTCIGQSFIFYICPPGTNIETQNNRQNLIDNPHLVDWFFTKRLENFLKHWLYKSLDAAWHWYRYEYQARRGSIHSHCVAKLKNDPNLCYLAATASEGYLAEKDFEENRLKQNNDQLLNKIQKGKEASKALCQYADWLLSTMNLLPPDENLWHKPQSHPCQKKITQISDNDDEDYIDLLKTCQRHTRCSTQYCLKHKSNDSELKCRFNFPYELYNETKLEFEPVHIKDKSVKYRVILVTKRNDSRLNNHQRLQLQGWRGNCDIHVIIDMHACLEYITKYAAKGEPKSPVLKQVLNSVIKNVDNTSSPNRLIKKIMMKSLGERDFSAQETMYHLMSLKLYSSSFNVLTVDLEGSRRLRSFMADTDAVTDNSPLDVYANRQQFCNGSKDIMNKNFVDFTTKYKVIKKQLIRQPNNFVPRIFPTYSSNPKGVNFPLYCKYQLLRYKPWVVDQSNAWDNDEQYDEIYITAWKHFLETPYAQTYVPNWLEKFSDVENQQDDSLSNNHSATEDCTAKYTCQQIGEMPS